MSIKDIKNIQKEFIKKSVDLFESVSLSCSIIHCTLNIRNFLVLLFVAVFLSHNQYWPGGFMVLWWFFNVQENTKAQPAVVLVLKHLRR